MPQVLGTFGILCVRYDVDGDAGVDQCRALAPVGMHVDSVPGWEMNP